MVFLLFGITGLILLADQLTKFMVFKYEGSFVLINKVIEIVHTMNDGIAFGFGGGMKHGAFVWSILSIITVSFLFIFYAKYTQKRLIDTIAFGLILGGALGNLVDRIITSGKVRDFIQLSFMNWPAFNIADITIVAGVVVMIFAIAFDHVEDEEGKQPADQSGSGGPEQELR